MTPGARIAAAMELLDEIVGGAPAERSLTRWGRASRFAGSKDRAAVRDLVFDVLRRRASCAYASGAVEESGRALVVGYLVRFAPGDLELFTGERHAPLPLTPAERAVLRADLEDAPRCVREDMPSFLDEELSRSLGATRAAVCEALTRRAPLDLRVNERKATRDRAVGLLAREGIGAIPIDGVHFGLRVTDNPRAVARSLAYQSGVVEVQDAASQLAVQLLDVKPGMRVLDLCAGGGGKTLALAARMAGTGRLCAYDANPHRMRDIAPRAERAGVDVEVLDEEALDCNSGQFDLILADVPCSGSGAWRRNPEQKWRLTPEELSNLLKVQAKIFDRATALLSSGGVLAFATCSLLRCENEDQISAFLSRHPAFAIQSFRRMPLDAPGDGFYCCTIRQV